MEDSLHIDQKAVLERIQNYLDIHRMTQKELCDRAGIDTGTFSKFKTFKTKSLGTENYFRLARAMMMTAEELLYGTLPIPNVRGIDNEEKVLLKDFRALDPDDKKLVAKMTQRLKEGNIFARFEKESGCNQ